MKPFKKRDEIAIPKEEKKWRRCLGNSTHCKGTVFGTRARRLCDNCKAKIYYHESGLLEKRQCLDRSKKGAE